MNIKFQPQDTKWPHDRSVLTNIGEFRPGQVLSMMDYQVAEARRLVANGDFIEVADAPLPSTVGTLAPEIQEQEGVAGAAEFETAPTKRSKR